MARTVLNKKRAFIEEHKELYPTFFYYMKDLSTLFNTISLQGGHEGLINFGFVKRDARGRIVEEESGLFHPEGLEFARKVSRFILNKLKEFMERDGVPWNFEYAPRRAPNWPRRTWTSGGRSRKEGRKSSSSSGASGGARWTAFRPS